MNPQNLYTFIFVHQDRKASSITVQYFSPEFFVYSNILLPVYESMTYKSICYHKVRHLFVKGTHIQKILTVSKAHLGHFR